MIVNSSQGGGSKDTWVLEDDDGRGAPRRDATPAARASSRRTMPGLRYGGDWQGQQQQQQQLRTASAGASRVRPSR